VSRSHALILAALAALVLLASWAGCSGRMESDPPPAEPLLHPDPMEQLPDMTSRRRVGANDGVHVEPLPEKGRLHPLTVSVTRPDGRPVVDAVLVVTSRGRDWGATPRTLRQGTTETDGRNVMLIREGAYVVRGTHPDLHILGAEFDVPEVGAVTLRAGAGPRIVLTIETEEGEPVEGAIAWELHNSAGGVAISDSEGRADLGRVYPENPFVLVEAEGFARWSNYVFGFWDGRDVYERRVRLKRTQPVSVRVLEHDGSPAAGAVLRYSGGSRTCDDDGRAEVGVLAFGSSCRIRAQHADERQVDVILERAPDAGEVVELRLPPHTPLHGRVVHAWTEEPVAGARVLVGSDADEPHAAETDDEGRFTLTHVAGGSADWLVAFADGLGPTGEGWGDVEADEDGTYTLRVAPTLTLSGRVVDEAGEPLASADVEGMVYGDSPPLGPTPRRAATAADGTFTLHDLPAVPSLMAMAHAGRGTGWSAVDSEVPPTPDSSFDLGDVVVPAGFALDDVPVVDDDGDVVPSAILWVRWRIVGQGTPATHRMVLHGIFETIPDIPRDSAVAEVTAPGLLKTVQRVDRTTERIVVDRPCTVSGRVVREGTAEPVAGVWVIVESKDRLHTLDGNHGGSQTGADGAFSFGGLRKGRYRIRFEAGDDTRLASETSEIDVLSRETSLGTLSVR
jgi:hypothetical protein